MQDRSVCLIKIYQYSYSSSYFSLMLLKKSPSSIVDFLKREPLKIGIVLRFTCLDTNVLELTALDIDTDSLKHFKTIFSKEKSYFSRSSGCLFSSVDSQSTFCPPSSMTSHFAGKSPSDRLTHNTDSSAYCQHPSLA